MLHLRDTWALRGLPALPCRTLQGGAATGSGGFLTQFAGIKVEMIQGKVWKSRWKFIKCAFAFNLNLMHIYKQCRNSLLIHLQLIYSSAQKTQVPKTSVNLDGDVREKFMWPPSLLTQGSQEWRVSQISTSRILHSGPNFRWIDFLY